MNRVAINGMGRIGRATFKILMDTPELDLVAYNDLLSTDNLVYLLRYDSVYGRYHKQVESRENALFVNGKECKAFSEKDPARLPWKDLNIDTVFECTGVFTTREGMEKHIQAGAKRVILSAPDKNGEVFTVVPGVNQADPSTQIISCASCTTNCITPVVEVMGRRIGIAKAIMTTIHAYTSSQALVDGPGKKFRRGRAAGLNLVPTTTGAGKATTRVLPQYEGKFDGVAVRAPVPVGSISDIVFVTTRETSVEEINAVFREEAESPRYRGIMGVVEELIVSTDIIQDAHGSIVDLTMTQVVDGNLVKVMSWYDNEWGYSNQMIREAVRLAKES